MTDIAVEALAEHLCARRPCGDTPENVADWLVHSLNRCGLALTQAPKAVEPSEDEVRRVARKLCAARGESPDGSQVRFVDGGAHSATFLEIAQRDVRTVITAMREEQDRGQD